MIAGTQGYPERAKELLKRYEAVSFTEKYKSILHLLPTSPARVLDVGAGTGADAAWFASQGHSVVAVEPTDELREPGKLLHPSFSIDWLKDSLPDLALVLARDQRFDVVMLSAVWMHLDEEERRIAMPKLTSLIAPEGIMVMSLRHGPVPAGRRMFDVSGEETIALATDYGLRTVLCAHTGSVQGLNQIQDVTWTFLAFRRST